MKAKEIREKSSIDLSKTEVLLRHDISMARLQLKSGQLANTAKIKSLRKDLARVLTLRKTT